MITEFNTKIYRRNNVFKSVMKVRIVTDVLPISLMLLFQSTKTECDGLLKKVLLKSVPSFSFSVT